MGTNSVGDSSTSLSPITKSSQSSPTVADDRTYTVHDAIESVGFGRFQIILSAIAGFAWMADSMEIMLLSIMSPSLECEWGISSLEQAMTATAVFIGWMISSPIWGWFCDRYGRKKGLILSALSGTVFGVATAFAPSYGVFIGIRTCVGLALGGIAQSATLYTEFLPTKHRAGCIILLEVFWAIGAAIESVVALVVMPLWGWRGLVACSSVPLMIFVVCCFWLPESARYHITRHETETALGILERVAEYNRSELPKGELVVEKGQHGKTSVSIRALLKGTQLKITLLVWTAWFVNAFSYYGMALYTTKFLQSTDECHGGGVEGVNATTSGCRHLTSDNYIDIVKTSFSELPGLFFTFLIVERIGRKLTMGLQFVGFAACNYILYFCMSHTLLVVILMFGRAFVAGAFQTAYVYTPEVYPTPMRALGLGTASAWARAGAILTPFVAQGIGQINIEYATLIYGTTGLIGAVASFFLPVETKGKGLSDVRE